ncbi:MAG: DUF6754 domain-containing protein [candidate division Zixibacteria bacterium]|nr:DUF6754 domain-containing protein [candidate division Zixibacteria bacterium]
MDSLITVLSYYDIIIAIVDQDWFDVDKLPTLIVAVVAITIVLYATYNRSSREKFVMREIPGLRAVEDAIGRATEMNRPLLFTPGWGGDIQRPTTIASMNILSHVAEKTASYDCRLVYPTHDPVIMTVAQEVVAEAYARTGYPDRFHREDVNYVSSSQFGYAAAVDGMISRLEPASVFLLGTFEAESLILAETGNSVGAIQIAGTDSTIQLAFFIVACDYTLIGEELFAASGYLSGDHSILASVRAQDILKLLIMLFLVTAVVWNTVSVITGSNTGCWWEF